MAKILTLALITVGLFVLTAAPLAAQTTTFTYQGSLKDGANAANGNYDFEFALFSAAAGGTQFGSTLTRPTVAVVDGIFTVNLDFGNQFLGAARFLEIRVWPTGGGAFTPLLPRQFVTSAPYSVKSLNSDTAANATNATTATNATQLGGVAANQYVLTGDTRLSDARNPLAGSPNYIQNQNAAAQAASNFNISGSGTAGGTLSGNSINSVTQYNIGGARVLSIPGSNTFVGSGTGTLTTGFSNSFFGRNVGIANAAASGNSFFGEGAGGSNVTGGNNTMIGVFADVGSGALNFATAIGAGSVVSTSNTIMLGRSAGSETVQVPGDLNVAGTLNANLTGSGANLSNLNASNITTGTLSSARLGVVPIANGGTGSATKNFVDLSTVQTINGDKSFSGTLSGQAVNTQTSYRIAGNPVLIAGPANTFAGVGAGAVNNTGFDNSFFGRDTGNANINGNQNSFFGKNAGFTNTAGQGNSFFGVNAGFSSTGNANSFFGEFAGNFNGTGSNNTIIGTDADVASGALTFATALGSGSVVGTSNTVMLGRPAGLDSVRTSGLTRAGSETGTSQPPVIDSGTYNGLVTRRINSSDPTLGSVVARTNFLRLQRDGTAAGWRIVNDPLPAGSGESQSVHCLAITSSGASIAARIMVPQGNPSGANVLFSNALDVEYMQCSFGNTFVTRHLTQVTLQRFQNDNYWSGTVTSTFNQ